MQPVDYIALAIPVFFALIGIEILVARIQGERLYRLNDSLADLATGILQQVFGLFTKVVVVGVYAWIWQEGRLATVPSTLTAWVLCFLGVDFFYYWFHRVSHESSLPWGAHIVHHSSEEYNLAVALRQGTFQPLFSFLFYLPLAWIGFPPLMFLACVSANTLYQFWIHTRTIGKLGPLEGVLNTPSHHRVHHGCDAKYIDRNYAGVFIVWDRFFGTFQAEQEEPTYGITKPLRSWNPVWANLHHYADLAGKSRRAPSLLEAAKLWWKPPGWKPAWAGEGWARETGPTPLSHGEAGKYDALPPRPLAAYAVLHFVVAILVTVGLLFLQGSLSGGERLTLAAWVVASLVVIGGIFDRRRWVVPAELTRLALTWATALWLVAHYAPEQTGWVAGLGSLAAGASAAWLLRGREQSIP
ncbi:MAG TPA: sterol desaturase family protein [Thermoanaerobaculia bacterium]|nr:sterol desaturase family protein [Thermoanaerobaculia bacterium]